MEVIKMKTKISRIGKKSLSVIIALMMIVSTMLFGMVTANANDANVTIYFTPSDNWLNNNYTIKANFKYGSQGTEWDTSNAAVDTNKTIGSKKVYSVSFVLKYDGLYDLQLLAFDSSNTQKEYINIYSGGWYTYNNYNNKYWNGSSWVEPSWDSGSGETDNYDTHIYALTTQSANMKLHAWNVNSSGLNNGGNNPMSLVATYNNGSKYFYLWKIGYNMQTTNPSFIIYSNEGNLTNETKLTNNVTEIKTKGDYFFDLKDTELGKQSISSATGTYKPLTVSGSLTTSNTINAGDSVDLSTAFTGLTITGSVYEYLNSAYTTTYAIDGNTVSSPWTATAGTHTITATVSGGEDTSNNVFESVSTTDASFTVNSSSTPSTDYYYSYNNGSNQFVKMDVDTKYGGYVIRVNTTNGYLNADKKFKIANVGNNDNGQLDKSDNCVNYNITVSNVERSTSLSGVTFYFDGTYKDLYIQGTSLTDFYIQYTPGGAKGLAGKIKVWSVEDYNGTVDPKTYTIKKGNVDAAKGDFDVTVGGTSATSAVKDATVTVAPTPTDGYVVDKVTYTPEGGTETEVTLTDSAYKFNMPAKNVTVNVTFKEVATTKTYDVVKGESQDSISMTETSSGSGIFVSSGTINHNDYFTIRKTYGSEVTYAAHSANYYFSNSSLKPKVYNWTTSYSHNTNIYINNLNSAQYVYYDSNKDQIYLQSTGSGSSGGGTLPDQYFLISNADNPSNWTESMFHQANKDSDGKYYITITPKEIADLAGAYNSNVYFTMASAKSVNNIYFQDSNSPHATTTDESLISVEDKNNSGKKFCRFSIKSDSVISVTISYDNNNTFSVIPESSKIDSSVEVIAKDATIRTDGLQSTLHTYGNTYFYTVGSDGSKTYYTKGTMLIKNKMSFTRESQKSVAAVSLDEVKKGTTLHIETQNVKDGYYVAGYVVNGETLALFKQKETPVLDYTIPYDTEANTKIEITPVYFATDSSTCVTFYVEGFDSTVQKTWGNTIACYPYYSGTEDTKNAFSCYPGQPMLYKDGKYFIQIPRTFGGNKVVGMTLNNYKWDDVHGSINKLDNAQTYDYDDFVRIADKMEDGKYIADNIIFSFKFRTNHNNFDYNTDDSRVSPSPISYDTFDAGNGWENLTDHNGNLVNIFGTQLFKTTDPRYSAKSKIEDNPTGNEHLLIVSNGYDENYQGFYATEWTIYAYNENAYKKVAQIPSSALLLSYDKVANSTEVSGVENHEYLSQLSSYAPDYAALNIDKYKNLPAYITYEQNDKQKYNNDGNGGNEGYRCDGRWYYSRINDDIISNVKIQYAESMTGTFNDDPFETDSNVGKTTKAKAYFTNSNAYDNTTCEGKIGNGNFDITTTYSDSTYMFVGWYLEKEGVYTKLTNSTNASIEMTGSETYVARYVKVPTDSINISHSLFSNVSETAKKGAGTLGLKVTLSYNDGTNEFNKSYTSNTSDSSVSTNVLLSDVQKFYINVSSSVDPSSLDPNCFSIKVSLTSNPADKTSLKNAYVEDYINENVSYLSFSTDSSTISNNLNWIAPSVGKSMEVSIPFNKIFTDGNPITNNVEFFSEFETDPVEYEITYNFTTRLYGEKQFKSNGTVSVGEEGLISANGTYSFKKAYIMSVAPDESNFMKRFYWDDASITQSYDSANHKITVTVDSIQEVKTVRATIKRFDKEDKIIDTVYGGHFTDEEGKFVMAPAINASNQDFSYWRINAVNDDGTEGAFVANCYSQYFNYVGYDNYIVTAVYGDGKNTDIYDKSNTSTTVTFLEYSRNHWNDFDSKNKPHPNGAPYGETGTEYDRLYADFALAFNYDGKLLNATEVDGLKLGYVLDVTGNSTESELKTGILENQDKSSFKINNSNNVLNYSIDRTALDNKNRIECYYGIKNTDKNRTYNIKVYSYMIVNGEVTLSEQPITICYSGAINEQGGNNNET